MWLTLLKVQKVIQQIRPLRIQYHENNGGFHETHTKTRKIISFLVDSNVLLIWIASLLCLKSVMTETPDPSVSVQQSILRMVLQVLVFGLFSLFLAAVYTFQSRGSTTVWMMTQAIGFYAKRERKHQKSQKTKKFSMFDLLLYGMVGVCTVGASTIPLMPVLSSNTPAHLILYTILPEPAIAQLKSVPFLVTIICCTYLAIFGYLGVVPVLQIFIYMCGVLYESTFMLKSTYIKGNLGFLRLSSFPRNKSIFMQSFLFMQSYNDFGYVYFPLVIGTGFVVNVVTSLICIEFYAHLHPFLFACFAGFDFICAGLTLGINSFAMVGSEESDKFHRYWSVRLFTTQQRKDGPYFVLKRTTLLNTTSEVVKATVSLLIMDG